MEAILYLEPFGGVHREYFTTSLQIYKDCKVS